MAAAVVVAVVVGAVGVRSKQQDARAAIPDERMPRRSSAVTFGDVAEEVRRPEGSVRAAGGGEQTLKERVARLRDPQQALTLLREQYERAKRAYSQEALQETLDAAISLADDCRHTRHWCPALRLVYRCHLQLGDRDAAQQAFLAYAEAVGEQAGPDGQAEGATAKAIMDEAVRLFNQSDALGAMRLCEVLSARYEGKEPGRWGRTLTGVRYAKMGMAAEAAKVLTEVVSEAPESPAAMRARLSLPKVLFEAGRKDEAVAACLDRARYAREPRERAAGHYHAAMVLLRIGPSRRAEALRLLRKVADEHPDTAYGRKAKERLAAAHRDIERQILEP